MRKLRYVLLLTVLAVSVFASLGFIKPASAAYPWGIHELKFNWYQSYIYDDHDGRGKGAGEWFFESYSYDLDEFKEEWGGEYERDDPGWVDHKDHIWNFVMREGSDTKFELAAWEEDLLGFDEASWAEVLPKIPKDWGYTIQPNRWYWDNKRDVDTRFYWKYYISNDAPTALSPGAMYVTEGDPVSFTAPTIIEPEGDDITGYHWDFDDGTTSTARNPTHTYTEVGKYSVSFKAKDYFGAWSDPQTMYVHVSPVFSVTLDENTYKIRTRTNAVMLYAFGYSASSMRINFQASFSYRYEFGDYILEGWVEVTIPKSFMLGGWTVTIEGSPPETLTKTETATDTTLYMTYSRIYEEPPPITAKTVRITGTWIVPEFPAAILTPLLMIATLAAVVLGKKALSTRPKERVFNSAPKVS